MMRSLGLVFMLIVACGPVVVVLTLGILNFSPSWAMHLAETVLPGYLRASAQTLLMSTVVAGMIGGLAAALTHTYDFPGRRIAVFCQLMPLAIPAHVAAAIWFEFTDGSLAILGFVHGAAAAPVVFLLTRLGLASIPVSVRFAAATLGSSVWGRIGRVYLPLLSVTALASLLLIAASVLGDEAAARRLGISTLAVGMLDQWQVLQREDLTTLLTLLLLMLAAICLLPISRWVLTKPKIFIADKDHHRENLGLGRGLLSLVACLILVLPGFFLPLGACLAWMSTRVHRVDLSSLLTDVLSTLLTSVVITCIVCGLSLVFAALAQPGAKARRFEALLWLPVLSYLMPALVLALTFLKLGAMWGWNGSTRWMIIGAASIRFFPIVLLPTIAVLAALPSDMIDSARTLGESRMGTFRRVVMPTVLPALSVGGILVLIEAVNELTLSQLLQPFGYRSLSLRIGALTMIHMVRDAGTWVVLSVLVCTLPIWLLTSAMEPHEGYDA